MSGKSLAMMPWFPRDFIAATRHLALAERGAYRELLDYQWEMGVLPKDPMRLARLLVITPDEFAPIWAAIGDKFEECGAGLANKRLEEHRKKAVEQRDKKINGAQKTNAKRYAQHDAERDAKRLDIASPPSPSPSPSPKKRKTKTLIPEDFALTEELQRYAVTHLPDVDPSALFESFRGKAMAKGWAYANWEQALQEFVRNCAPNSGHWAAGQYPKINGNVKWM
jgi:uncharacterized protein YdaU (DUF1376 family)